MKTQGLRDGKGFCRDGLLGYFTSLAILISSGQTLNCERVGD